MGGETTGCLTDTTDVFLEVAYFDPVRTAHTGRTLGIVSDARYRFERGVDTAFLPDACELATKMILELCGGEASAPVTAGSAPVWDRHYPLRADRCETLGGLAVPAKRQIEILSALGFSVSPDGDAAYAVSPPSWRGDVVGEADLVEEVLRVVGFDAIPALPLRPAGALSAPAVDTRQRREFMAKRLLAGRGLLETVTWSFMAAEDATVFSAPNPALTLINPISADLSVMRPSILGNLAKAAGRNLDRGYPDVALFELGPMFKGTKDTEQMRAIALLRSGQSVPRHWTGGPRAVDVFDAKADVIALLDELGGPTDRLQTTTDAPGYYHPGRSGMLRLGPTVVAQFGELHPATLKALNVKGPMVAAEIFLGAIPLKKGQSAARPLLRPSPLQPVGRDFAFLVDASVSAAKLERAIIGADKALITKAQVFDIYQGTGVPDGQKSLAVAVTLQPVKEALDEEALKALTQKVVASVLKHTGGTLRG
jgi:phenylalanyl-tRNA synthetase beta chain